VGIPPVVALGCTIRLVETCPEMLESAALCLAAPVALRIVISTLINADVNRHINLVGR